MGGASTAAGGPSSSAALLPGSQSKRQACAGSAPAAAIPYTMSPIPHTPGAVPAFLSAAAVSAVYGTETAPEK